MTARTAAAAAVVLSLLAAEAAAAPSNPALSEAQAHVQAGDLPAAVIVLRNAIRKSPEDGLLSLELGRLQLRLGDVLAAEAAFGTARKKAVDEALVLPWLAQARLARGDAEAVTRTQPATDWPSEAAAHLLAVRGEAWLLLGKRHAAARDIDEAGRLAPALAPVMLATARLRETDGKPDQAEAILDRIIANDRGDADALTLKAKLRQAVGDVAGAAALIDRVVALQPTAILPRVARIGLLQGVGRSDEADRELTALLKAAPDHPLLRLFKAQQLAKAGQAAEAWELLRPAMPALAKHRPAEMLAAAVALEAGQLLPAGQYAEAVLAGDPDSRLGLRVLGEVRLRGGDGKAAAPLFERLLRQTPEDRAIQVRLGDAYARAGRHADAALLFQQAAGPAPEDEGLQLRLGIARMNSGDAAGAEAALAKGGEKAAGALATLYLRQGRWPEARQAIAAFSRDQPSSPLPDHLLGQLEAAAGDPAKAEAAFLAALAKSPGYDEARLALARLYRREGAAAKEERLYRDILARDQRNEAALLGRITLAWEQGAAEQALALAAEAAALLRDSVAVGQTRIALLQRADKRAEAVAEARRLAAAHSGRADTQAILGRLLADLGATEEAVDVVRRASLSAPASAPLRLLLAETLLKADRGAEARAALDEAVKLTPELLPAWRLRLADEMRRKGEGAALRLAEEAKAVSPLLGEAVRGEALMAAGRPAEAARAYGVVYDKAPSALILHRRHEALSQAGQLDEAARVLAEWLDKTPGDHRARLLLADLKLAKGDTAAAVADYEEVLRDAPDTAVALNNLAWLRGQEAPAKGLPLAERAYRLQPNSPGIADTYGWLLLREGRAKAAAAVLQAAAADSHGTRPGIVYHLAAALAESGEAAKALAALRPILDRRFPEADQARALYRRLGGN